MLCPAAQPLAGFSSWGCSLKSKVWWEDHSSVAASPSPRVFGSFLLPVFPPIPIFLADFAPGWHSWMSAGIIATHPPTPSLSAVYLLCLLFASPQPLNTGGEGNHPAPLAPSPWALAGGTRGKSPRSGSAAAATVGLAPHAARISCWVRNMLPFSSPAVAADGYGKRKVVGSLAPLNQGSDGQKGGAEEGGSVCLRLGFV